jgi:hypothetical protein
MEYGQSLLDCLWRYNQREIKKGRTRIEEKLHTRMAYTFNEGERSNKTVSDSYITLLTQTRILMGGINNTENKVCRKYEAKRP